ncbi:hypothetical protein [Sphingobacterium sp. LRF_L2]|uniref:hypothetical protein n=1 Tax=Sphingobacterium sp. LRF_L2 TaxID=3369421 RepID=UPI003F6009EA
MRVVAFSLVFILGACEVRRDNTKAGESDVLQELVLLRTEGLIMTEYMLSNADNKEILTVCKRVKKYYTLTHPDFLRLCTGYSMELKESDFTLLWNDVHQRFIAARDSVDCFYLDCYQENIRSTIALYENLIRRQESEGISYFSFVALPDLYNQYDEFAAMRAGIALSTKASF